MDKNKLIAACVVVVALIGLALFYRYETVPAGNNGGMYRIDRFTGETTYIYGRSATPSMDPAKRPGPFDDLIPKQPQR